MYTWCRTHNYSRLWAYMFINWYSSEQWNLWARSHNPDEIPILKTTMIVESHWRKLKYDYFHRFKWPRTDLVTWILIIRSIPDVLNRMKAILDGDERIGAASWRKDIRKDWKQFQVQSFNPHNLFKYNTDPKKWTCGCETFFTKQISHF